MTNSNQKDIQTALDIIFKLRKTSTKELQRMAVARGLDARGERVKLLRSIYQYEASRTKDTPEN